MFGKIKEPIITGVIYGDSTVKASVNKRNTHLLIYKISGESLYYLRDKCVNLVQGSILYIPEGETYKFEKISDGESLYYLVNFHADIEMPIAPMIICNDKSERVLKIFKEMRKVWSSVDSPSKNYEMISLFYHLVSTLVSFRKQSYITKEQKNKIKPAVDYLEENIYDPNLKIYGLSELCGMSEVMFRKLFNLRFGLSPKKYIIQTRMQTAMAIFENGEFESISAVARQVGYDDPLHFSKCFKAFFGYSPNNIKT